MTSKKSRRKLAKYLTESFDLDYEKVFSTIQDYETRPRVSVVGSRYFGCRGNPETRLKQKSWIEAKLEEFLPDNVLYIISGGAAGIDTFARDYSLTRGILFLKFPYEKSMGKAGGPFRNAEIVQASTHMIAFPGPGSIGTWDSVNKAKAAGFSPKIIPVRE